MVLKTDLQSVVVADGDITAISVTIPAGTAVSSAIYVGGATFLGLRMPAAWDAATIKFEESKDSTDADFRTLTDGDGNDIVIATPTANKTHKLDINTFYGLPYIKLVSSVNQTADRLIEIIMAGV